MTIDRTSRQGTLVDLPWVQNAMSAVVPGLSLRRAGKLACILFIAASVPLRAAQSQADDFRTLAGRADAARGQGDTVGAVELYQQAVQQNPAWPDGWWFLGVLQYDSNRFLPARDAFSRYIELTPNAGPALALRGLCEFEMKQYQESLQDLQHGLSLGAANQPRNARILLYHEALLLTRAGEYEQSIAVFTQLADQQSANEDLADGLGLAALRRPELPSEEQPDEAALLTSAGLASLRLMKGDFDGASQDFQALFAQSPRMPNLHYTYGYLLFASRPEQAIDQLQQELTIAPHSPHAHAMLAWAEGAQGDFLRARDDAAKAVAEEPALAMGQLIYGRALVETGRVSDGLPHLEDVVKAEPGNLEAHLTLAKAYSKLGRADDARRERLECLTISDKVAAPVANP